MKQDSIIPNSTLTSPKIILEIPTKNYVDNKYNDPSIIKNTYHVDFNKDFYIVQSIKVNSFPTLEQDLTPKIYVDNAISYSVDEASLLRLDPDEKLKLDEQGSIVLNSTLTSPKTILEIPTKSYVDSLHESSRNRRDLSSVFIDQDNVFDNNKLTNLDFVTVNRNPNLDNELANKKYIDDELDKNTVLRFNQTLENISKYLSETTHIILLNLIKYKLQIQQLLNILTQVVIFYSNGLSNVMIKITMVKFSILLNQQKQTVQQVIQERLLCLQSVIRLCSWRHHLIIMVIMLLSASNEQIIFKLGI